MYPEEMSLRVDPRKDTMEISISAWHEQALPMIDGEAPSVSPQVYPGSETLRMPRSIRLVGHTGLVAGTSAPQLSGCRAGQGSPGRGQRVASTGSKAYHDLRAQKRRRCSRHPDIFPCGSLPFPHATYAVCATAASKARRPTKHSDITQCVFFSDRRDLSSKQDISVARVSVGNLSACLVTA